jgi:hypothetical protein
MMTNEGDEKENDNKDEDEDEGDDDGGVTVVGEDAAAERPLRQGYFSGQIDDSHLQPGMPCVEREAGPTCDQINDPCPGEGLHKVLGIGDPSHSELDE